MAPEITSASLLLVIVLTYHGVVESLVVVNRLPRRSQDVFGFGPDVLMLFFFLLGCPGAEKFHVTEIYKVCDCPRCSFAPTTTAGCPVTCLEMAEGSAWQQITSLEETDLEKDPA